MTAPESRSTDEIGGTRVWRTPPWASAAMFMVLPDGTILFVAFPSIRRRFPTVPSSDLRWILNAYTVHAALLAPAGRMADRLPIDTRQVSEPAVVTSAEASLGVAAKAGDLL
jgi:MFS family permease